MIDSQNFRNDYVGNNTTANYEYDFKIFDEDHLLVTVRTAAGVEITLVKTTDYTVSNVGTEAGGTVTLVDGNQAWLDSITGFLDDDMELVLTRNVPLLQESDFANQEDFYPETHEAQFDTLVMMIQQLQEELRRCVKVSIADYTSPLILPKVSARALQNFSFDANGLPTV